MWPFFVIALDPSIYIVLQLLDRFVELLSECDLIELLKHRLVESLTDTIGLWTSRFGSCVFDLFNSKLELVLMMLWASAVLSASIGEDTKHGNVLFFEERNHLVIKHIGSHQCILAII